MDKKFYVTPEMEMLDLKINTILITQSNNEAPEIVDDFPPED